VPTTATASGRWHTHIVTYSDHSRSPWDVRTAVTQWNRSQTGIRLVPARGRRRAQIIIRASGCPFRFPGHSLGGPCGRFPPDGRVWLDSDTDGYGSARFSELTAHELGHALGLEHAGGCSVMVPNLSQKECSSFSCGPTQADARKIVAIYGGRVRSGDRARGCLWFLPLPPKPAATLVSPRDPAPATDLRRGAISPDGVLLELRNDSRFAWGRRVWGPYDNDDVELLTVDAQGKRVKYFDNCVRTPEGSIGDILRDPSAGATRPGRAGTFRLRVCPPSEDQTIYLRMYTVGRGATLPGKEIFTVRIKGRGSSDPEDPGFTGANRPPSASFSFTPRGSDNTVDFLNTSKDPDGEVQSQTWDFGDPASPDNTSTEYAPAHAYSAPGTYTVTLTVTDTRGATATTSQQVSP
jgi:PKD domain-containing protein/matrixin